MKISRINWQVAAAYVGTLIGAGFASGQELMQFFVRFGIKGIWGAVVTGFFFSFLGGMTIYLTKHYGFRTYKDLLDLTLGPKISVLIDGLIMIFLFLGLSVMLSGSGALFKEHLGQPAILGVMVTEALVLLALLARDEGVLWFNAILTPMLVTILGMVAISSIISTPAVGQGDIMYDPFAGSLIVNNWLFSSIVYISYNMIGAVVVLVALTADKKNCSFLGGALGGGFLFLLCLGTVTALLKAGSGAVSYQIPMLYLAYQVNPLVFYLYGAVLWGAMITTAVADAYGLCRRLQFAWNIPYFVIIIIVAICVIPFSMYDFAQLVSKVYPLFGYLSLIIILALMGQSILLFKQYLYLQIKRLRLFK
ncbi:MAG: hypothetical protein AAGU27_14195 [Dehalobacterium sp.]